MLIKIVALIVPVGLDALGVSTALAVAGLSRARRLRTWLLLTASEAAAPVVGILVERPLAGIGRGVDLAAAAVLIVFAVRMLMDSGDGDARIGGVLDHGALAVGVLAVSVGLDELAIGVELGILHAPVGPVVVAVVAEALAVSLVGLLVGERLGGRAGDGAERVAGIILAIVAIALLVEALTGG